MKVNEANLLLIREEERVKKRFDSLLKRKDVMNSFLNKRVSLKTFVVQLFGYYVSRRRSTNYTLTVSIKLTPYQATYIDLELTLKQRFLNRSDFIRNTIKDFISTHGDNKLMETLKSEGVFDLNHGND